jgi:hypothetical protein
MAASNSCLVTSRPGRSTRWQSTAKVFGRSRITSAPRRSCSAARSSSKGGKGRVVSDRMCRWIRRNFDRNTTSLGFPALVASG